MRQKIVRYVLWSVGGLLLISAALTGTAVYYTYKKLYYVDCSTLQNRTSAEENDRLDPWTAFRVGHVNMVGQCVAKDLRMSEVYLRLADEAGLYYAPLWLGLLYSERREQEGKRYAAEMQHWFRKWALTEYLRSDDGRIELAREIIGRSELPDELMEAMAWVAGIKRLPVVERYGLALKVDAGDGVPQNRAAAQDIILETAEKDLTEAKFEYARRVLRGEYKPRKHQTPDGALWEAGYWLSVAAGRDYLPALKLYARHRLEGKQLACHIDEAYTALFRAESRGGAEVSAVLRQIEPYVSNAVKLEARERAKKGYDNFFHSNRGHCFAGIDLGDFGL